MAENNLMIVESPAKAHTIGKLLGAGTMVRASYGHVRDLPEGGGLHVDINHGFAPDYVLTASGKKVIGELKRLARKADNIYLATDPDREGEAISWHLSELLRPETKAPFYRISYHEITRSAITGAFSNPGKIDMKLVDAQQARRVLDRIVGFMVSPLACRNVAQKTSAGRVQSVALRLVVEREREIQHFVPEEYWNLDALFAPEGGQCVLKTRLSRIGGRKAQLHKGEQVNALASAVEDGKTVHRVLAVTDKPRRQNAAPPFITSTLQQAAGSFLHFSTSQTMKLAQELYEGVDSGNGAALGGLITYMRTDSVNIAKEAQAAARQFIAEKYGAQFVPEKPNNYRSGKSAQEAHEAIRPTSVERTPESLAAVLSPQQLKLYRLIWNRFVASQMAPAQQVDHSIEIESSGGSVAAVVSGWEWGDGEGKVSAAGKADSPAGVVFRTAARETLFPGYQIVYSMKDLGQEDELDDVAGRLPKMSAGVQCSLAEKPLKREQCFTQPPGRYSEASLVKAMESNGVGRPSTYAATVSALQFKKYVEKKNSTLFPTALGIKLNDYLVEYFPHLFNVGFTAEMEEQLDEIAEGQLDWIAMLTGFYQTFSQWLSVCGSVAAPGVLNEETQRKILQLFPEGFDFLPAPSPRYDDARFIRSVRKSLEGDGRTLTERQGGALLRLLGKYANLRPEFLAAAQELGLGELALRQCEAVRNAEKEHAANTAAVPDEIRSLLAGMKKIEWEKPVVRGKRTYDDGRFFRSLERQARDSGKLSPAQVSALQRLAVKYAAQLPPELVTGAAAAAGDGTADGGTANAGTAVHEEIAALFAQCEKISDWHAPVKRGKRTYDDHEFYNSLAEQYRVRRSLTDKQLSALKKMCAKYARGGAGEAAAPEK